jgi:AraC family transcriptional regulator
MTAIFLNSLAFSEIARVETGQHYPEIAPQFAIVDPLIRSIGMMLDEEMRSANPKPLSYGETLAAALASHIFSSYAKPVYREMRSLGSHWTQLQRSIEHIHDNIDKRLSLDQLAGIANMSKFHFAKSFREAMGIAPHQYLVKLRIEKARKLLTDPALSLSEVAKRVGYSDIGQFSAQFRKAAGASPKRYRRTADSK